MLLIDCFKACRNQQQLCVMLWYVTESSVLQYYNVLVVTAPDMLVASVAKSLDIQPSDANKVDTHTQSTQRYMHMFPLHLCVL